LPAAALPDVGITEATIVVRKSAPAVERTAAMVLSEEVELRSGVKWSVAEEWPTRGAAVALVSGDIEKLHGMDVPRKLYTSKPDGFAITMGHYSNGANYPIVWIVGADPRGTLFGVGKLLRIMSCRLNSVVIDAEPHLVSSPAYPIRGHQLGYRATANSYDAWDAKQFDRYVRELAFFGTNAIEAIPFQDTRPTPVLKYPRRDMNRALSESCERYGLEFWVWSPADFDLNDAQKRQAMLDEHRQLFEDCPRFDAFFFPGGDPGDNPPELVLPFMEEMAVLMTKYHPKAKIWISLQGFDDRAQDYFYSWVEKTMPAWMGGEVVGPSSPPIPLSRSRLPKPYGLRHYPDITHVVRCEYPVAYLDPAIAFTLGRECVNPRPVFYKHIQNTSAPYTNGFLTYSDGVHDDVNKVLWSALGWDPDVDLREVLAEYGRVFFGPDVAEQTADGLLAMEKDWEGSLLLNSGVDGMLSIWQGIETKAPELKDNWRFQLHLLRAYYEAYIRHRAIREAGLEEEANARMAEAPEAGADKAMDAALEILKSPDGGSPKPEWRQRVVDLCDALYGSIGFQSSVEKYYAIGAERGAVLDFIDYPLNNRWWLEDELAKTRALPSEAEKCAALARLATWENPGPGSFYDDIGNVRKSDHVIREERVNTVLDWERNPLPDYMWWEQGKTRVRQSWISKMDWPQGLRYYGLDPDAEYVVRTTGNGQCLPRVNGERLTPTADGKAVGDVKEFPVPKRLYRDRTILMTFDVPFEPGINWREASRLSEVWLIKK
jgi:hypothetical protein